VAADKFGLNNDSHTLPPKTHTPTNPLVTEFLKSRRQGLSPRTIEFYHSYLNLAHQVIEFNISGKEISTFISTLKCSNGGKHAYFRTLRAFYNWLYSPKSGYDLNPRDNPMLIVDALKMERRILPSLSEEQVEYLIKQATCIRDKAIISLFVDSGLRLTELANIKPENIDWDNGLIKVVCKGNKEGYAPFGMRTKKLLREWVSIYQGNGHLWDVDRWGIIEMLKQLRVKIGLPCNPYTFRRTFASLLSKRGVDSLHIMRLGRWESIAMVERYTRSVRFEDSLKLYTSIVT